jgi:phosphoglycolate phosphatase
MTALRLAVFDLDGTLVDSRANIVRAVEEVSRILGLPCPHIDVIPRVIGLSLDEALARLFPEVDAATHKTLEAEYRSAFVQLRTSPGYDEPLFPGSQEVIAALNDAGFVLGVATGKSRRGVRHLFDRHSLHERFVTIQTPDTARGKPHPDMVLQAMAAVGARPENTVMIGDTTFDIEMGRAAGARAIGVSWGNHPALELTAAGAHRLVERMADLAQAVHDLTSPLPTG